MKDEEEEQVMFIFSYEFCFVWHSVLLVVYYLLKLKTINHDGSK